MTVEFEIITDIAAPCERIFDLALDIDMHLASMARSNERAVAGVTTGRIGLGESVTWSARHYGIVWVMTSEITAIDPPDRFVDEQVRGPFRRFRHEHRFEPGGRGTLMADAISFDAPLGPLGRVAEVGWLRWYLPRLIRERNEHLRQAAERS